MAFNLTRAQDLFYEPVSPLQSEMIVEDLIPKGLTILAGSPKSCKSWMVLDMSLAVSSGRNFLGRRTRPCGVLYFALEDGRERAKKRILDLAEEPGPALCICHERRSIDQGFLKELDETLGDDSKFGLVIIDTLQKIRGSSSSSSANQYGADYEEISKLKSFADRKGIAIVCVHHLRKMQDKRDPVNEILGSAAMSGVPDQILLLKKDRFQTCGELSVIGRDVPQWKMHLRFEDLRWQLIKVETEEELLSQEIPEVLYRIADMVKERGKWTGTASQLLKEVGEAEMPPNVLSARMARYYYEVFYLAGISMRSRRTAKERLHILEYLPERSPNLNADISDSAESFEQAVAHEDGMNGAPPPSAVSSDWNSSVAEAKQILRRGR